MAKQTPGEWLTDFKRRWSAAQLCESHWQKQVMLLLELVRKLVFGRFPDEAKQAARMVLGEREA